MKHKLITRFKEFSELVYWKRKKSKEGRLTNTHYEFFFTDYFGLDHDFYTGKIIGDIGCGPRGSLEWADMTSRRIGIDPLADKYLKMGAGEHKMEYVKANSENIPFKDNYFDLISAFNSLNHVNDTEKTCKEIQRVLKPGGMSLLIVDIVPYPTPTEPLVLKWDFLQQYFSNFEIIIEKRIKRISGSKIYTNLRENIAAGPNDKKGVLAGMLRKVQG